MATQPTKQQAKKGQKMVLVPASHLRNLETRAFGKPAPEEATPEPWIPEPRGAPGRKTTSSQKGGKTIIRRGYNLLYRSCLPKDQFEIIQKTIHRHVDRLCDVKAGFRANSGLVLAVKNACKNEHECFSHYQNYWIIEAVMQVHLTSTKSKYSFSDFEAEWLPVTNSDSDSDEEEEAVPVAQEVVPVPKQKKSKKRPRESDEDNHEVDRNVEADDVDGGLVTKRRRLSGSVAPEEPSEEYQEEPAIVPPSPQEAATPANQPTLDQLLREEEAIASASIRRLLRKVSPTRENLESIAIKVHDECHTNRREDAVSWIAAWKKSGLKELPEPYTLDVDAYIDMHGTLDASTSTLNSDAPSTSAPKKSLQTERQSEPPSRAPENTSRPLRNSEPPQASTSSLAIARASLNLATKTSTTDSQALSSLDMLADAASKKPAVVPGKAVPSKSPAASAPTEQTPAAKKPMIQSFYDNSSDLESSASEFKDEETIASGKGKKATKVRAVKQAAAPTKSNPSRAAKNATAAAAAKQAEAKQGKAKQSAAAIKKGARQR